MKQETINRLSSIIDNKIDKYSYNFCRYEDDLTATLRSSLDYNYGSQNTGFAIPQDTDLSKPGSFSVIRSCIDSLVSKLASNKVRPYIHPINGQYKSQQITRQARQYFDVIFDKLHVNDLIMEAFRDACIFDTGYLFINPFTYELKKLSPWTVGLFNMEAAYGENKEMIIKMNNFPVTLLDKKYKKDYTGFQFVQYVMTISTVDHKAEIYINSVKKDSITYKPDVLPIIRLYYSKPVFGCRTYSLADALEGIQEQIDMLSSKISAASELTPGNVTYVVEGSSLSVGDVNNRTANVYGIKMPEGSSQLPVMNVAPAPMDPQWLNLLDMYVNRAYELTGISQLSAQSQKPAGLDSGAALATMEDIESARFQTQFDNYIMAYKDLARLIIKILPDDCNILPPTMNSASYKWADLKRDIDTFRVNFAADSATSKDPAEKLKQISQISQTGAIDINTLVQQLDSSDLESAYKDAAAKANAIDKCIENAIENGDYTVPDFVSYQDLYKKIMVTENELYSSFGDDEKSNKEVRESLLRVQTLENILSNIMEENGYIEQTSSTEEPMQSESGLTAVGNNEVATDIPGEGSVNVEAPEQDMAASAPINDESTEMETTN